MLGDKDMVLVGIVTILALLQYMVLGTLVGRARVRYGIEAPAITGDPMFERYFRVHQNMLEALVVFLPALWIFAYYMNAIVAAVVGVVFLLSRVLYVRGYLADPKRRAAGALTTFIINVVLVVGGLAGLVRTLLF